MSDRLEVAVVGVGRLGSVHARVIHELEGAELVAVVDIDAGRAAECATRHDTRAFDSVATLPPVDAAIVATPTSTHAQVARALIERGIHVLVEKPITTSVADGADLVAAARDAGVVLMVGHSERFNPAVRALDRMKLKPRFIDCHRVSPFSFRGADVGVVLDMMIHDIDIALHLVRSPLAEVHAVGVPVIGPAEDLANARLLFECGAVANITASRVALKTERVIRIFSPEAYVTLDYQKKRGRILRRGPALSGNGLDPSMFSAVTNPLEMMTRGLVTMEDVAMDDSQEPLVTEDTAFLEAVRTQTEPPVTGRDGLRALQAAQRIIQELNESLRREVEPGEMGASA